MSKRISLKREQVNAALRVAMAKIGKLPDGEKTTADVNLCLEIAYHVSSRLVVPWRPGKRATVKL